MSINVVLFLSTVYPLLEQYLLREAITAAHFVIHLLCNDSRFRFGFQVENTMGEAELFHGQR